MGLEKHTKSVSDDEDGSTNMISCVQEGCSTWVSNLLGKNTRGIQVRLVCTAEDVEKDGDAVF